MSEFDDVKWMDATLLRAEIERLRSQIDKLQYEALGDEDRYHNALSQIERLRSQLEDYRDACAQKQEIIDSETHLRKELQSRLAEYKHTPQAYELMQAERDELRTKWSDAESRLDQLREVDALQRQRKDREREELSGLLGALARKRGE